MASPSTESTGPGSRIHGAACWSRSIFALAVLGLVGAPACGKKPRKRVATEVVGGAGSNQPQATRTRPSRSVTAGGITPAAGTPKAVRDAMLGLATQKRRSVSALMTMGAEARGGAEQLLASKNLNEVSGALEFFAKHHQGAPWGVVAALLSHDAPEVRDAALATLATHGGTQHVAEVTPLLTHAKAGVRAHAARYLGRAGARQSTKQLMRLLADSNRDVANAAIAALVKVGDTTLGPELVTAAKAATTPLAARSTLAAARRLNVKIPATTLMRHVASPDVGLRAESMRHVAMLSKVERAAALKTATLGKSTPYLEALTANPSPDAQAEATAVAQELLKSATAPDRVLALRTLAAVGGEQVVTTLTTASADPSEAVRAAAVALLSAGKSSPAARAALKKVAVDDADSQTRHLALYALLRAPDHESVGFVIERLDNKADGGSAWLALTRLRGAPLPRKRGPWSEWRDSQYGAAAPTAPVTPKPASP